MDTLAARYRTGENQWTFTSRVTPALRALEDVGYVGLMGGVTANTIRASLTEAGRLEWLSASWVPPLVTLDRSDVVNALRTRCEELAAQAEATRRGHMALAELNDSYRAVLGAIARVAQEEESTALAQVVLKLIDAVKATL
ncbi:MAG TPA: hypothetical protein VMV41_01095 [Cellulomonadaceae bacterium]|nr:hypothetical protein [Cellulomonadaceae bacterium]